MLADPQLDRRDIFELLRMREVSWGERVVYALPLGSPQLTLYYRADLLERLGLEPPGSWSEYQELAARLAQRAELGELAPAGDAAWYGAIEPLGPGWAGQVLLARAAAYARHRSQYSTLFNYSTMEPLIAGPPFVRALEELVEAAGAGPAEAIGYGPAEARQRFLQGEAAMAWSWPTAARSGRDVARADRLVPTGFAELPGSSQVYNFRDQRWETRTDQEGSRVPLLAVAGRLASVTRQSRQPRPAFSLLVWLSGTELSDQVAPHSRHTTLFRSSHLQRPQLWMEAGTEADTARQYGEVVQQTQSRSSWLFALRIAGRAQYLAALDDAVHQALSGDKTAAEALEQAAARWQQITQSLGQQDQQRAYMRSLGLEL